MTKLKSLISIAIITLAIGLFVTNKDIFAQDANTVLLLHMDGTDGSTTFTDDSASAHSVTANGNAQISTAQNKFGGASGLFDGSGDYLSVSDSADWDLGSGDFTIDGWINLSSTTGTQQIVSAGDYNSGGAWGLVTYWDGAYQYLTFVRYSNGNPSNTFGFSRTWTASASTWYHVAVTRSGSTWRLFLDGSQLGSSTTNSDAIPDPASPGLIVGALRWGGSLTNYFNGYIDELRVSKGIARWTANFTPPTVPYVVSDGDGDGYLAVESGGDDCDDNDATVNPGAAEVTYNGKDDDCNPATPDDDLDGDGYVNATDCNDNDPSIHPGATEIANDGIDQDCDGSDLVVVNSNSLDAADGSPTDAVFVDNEGNVGIGTTNPGTYKLAVNGTIKTKEVVVESTGWSDFVFKDNYPLISLDQLEKYIKINKHLPQIPSAEEVAEKGVSVGDMQSRLLQKIEELTLYMIDIKKENKVLIIKSEKFEQENEVLKKRIEVLETSKM